MADPTILTDIGLAKFASATPEKQLTITQIAVGDGNGKYDPLSPSMTNLVNEVWRGSSSQPIRDPENEKVLIFETIIPAEAGGFFIREVGLFDEDGDLIAIGQTGVTEKPLTMDNTPLTLTIRFRLALMNSEDTELVYQDVPYIDHAGLSNRDAKDSHPISAISGLGDSLELKVDKKTEVKAGSGLTGGGSLSGDSVTLQMGTPSTINDSSKNTTTATSHTHEISKATTSQKGIVQLSNELSDREDLASTPKTANNLSKKIISLEESVNSVSYDEFSLVKSDKLSPAFEKATASSLKVKAGVSVNIPGASFDISGKTISMSNKTAGSDYVIVIDKNGNLSTMLDHFESPAVIPSGSYIIGGFHYSLIPEGETVSSGEFATSGKGMIWTQADVNRIRGINEFSIWDLRFRAGGAINSPRSARYEQLSNHGMVFDRSTNRWYAIYHVSTDVDKYGVSRSGTNLASGTVLPIIPSAFGGNGTNKYDNLNWWTANELVVSQGSRLLWEFEFNSRAFGVTENKVAGGASSTYPKTERIKGLTSRLGCEQATGVHWYWGLDSSYRHDGSEWSYKDVTGGRGQVYTYGTYGLVRVRFGGRRSNDAAHVGSRQTTWHDYPWYSHWYGGAVASRDLLIL